MVVRSVGQAQSGSSSGLGAGGIAGIVVGVVAALCLLGVVVFLALRCRGRSDRKDAGYPAMEPGRYHVGEPGRCVFAHDCYVVFCKNHRAPLS